jgi:hypothetical protein
MKRGHMRNTRYLILCLLLWLTGAAPANLTAPAYRPQRVLYIGDSLSVGPFGRELQEFLTEIFTEKRVYMYASCGSSPEHWLQGEPSFVTKCGCRVKTPSKALHYEYEKGRPPELFPTPKVEALLKESRPTLVIVQLGTNWFDRLEQRPTQEELDRLQGILVRFADAIQNSDSRPSLVWVTPPDSERFRRVQAPVTKLIRAVGRTRKDFAVIDSSNMVRYTMGSTGGDGVHYYGPDAIKWADGVKRRLLGLL